MWCFSGFLAVDDTKVEKLFARPKVWFMLTSELFDTVTNVSRLFMAVSKIAELMPPGPWPSDSVKKSPIRFRFLFGLTKLTKYPDVARLRWLRSCCQRA